MAIVSELTAYAQERGHTLLELAIASLVARPVVGSVITGATRPEQIRANATATDWQPTAADLAELDTLLKRAAADSPQA